MPGFGCTRTRAESGRDGTGEIERAAGWAGGRSRSISTLLFIAVILVYLPVRGFDFVNLDDGLYVTSNSHVRGGLTMSGIRWAFSNTDASMWIPLTWISHMLDCQLYGVNPAGHHLTSVLLHAVNTSLLFLILTRITRAPQRSLVVAALFGLHPLRIESVAWIAERKDVLSGLLFLSTLWAYANYVQRRQSRHLVLATLSLAAGLMAKPMLVTVPFLLLLLDYWPLARFRSETTGALLVEKLPLLLVAGSATMVAVVAGRAALLTTDQLPLTSRLANGALAYPSYLGKIAWPTRLAVVYPVAAVHSALDVLAAVVCVVGMTAFVVAAGRRVPYLPTGWFWFVGALVPTIGLLQAGVQAIADRFTYMPSIGVFMILAWGIGDILHRSHLPKFVPIGLSVIAIGAFAVATRLQLAYWRDSISLLSHATTVTSGNWLAHNNLGYALDEQGRVEEAIAQYRAALAANPLYPSALNNLGVSLAKQGKLPEAIESYRAAIALRPDYFTLNNLGEVLLRQGNVVEAVSDFAAALREKPDYALAADNLGTALALEGRTDEATAYFRTALALKPDYADAHYNLGAALAARGQFDEAIPEFVETLTIDPRYAKAHAALGNVLFREGRWADAVTHLRAAIGLDPTLADAHFHLATILSNQGSSDEARDHYREAVRLRPDLATQVPTHP